MKLRREIASVPLRTGQETWQAIVALISNGSSKDRAQLSAAESVMAHLLALEIYADRPLTLKGSGHRLVIYCFYGADAAIAGDSVDPIDWNPTAGDWTLHVPCPAEDIEWVGETLAQRSPRIVLHGLDEQIDEELETKAASDSPILNWDALRQ